MNRDSLEPLLNVWDPNNTVMLNLLRALPEGGLDVRATESSPSVSERRLLQGRSGAFSRGVDALRSVIFVNQT